MQDGYQMHIRSLMTRALLPVALWPQLGFQLEQHFHYQPILLHVLVTPLKTGIQHLMDQAPLIQMPNH